MVTQKTNSIRTQDMLKIMGVSSIAVAGTPTTVYTESVGLPRNATFAVSYKATSSGTVTLAITMEESNQLPTTEQVADANWVVPNDAAEIDDTLADEFKHSVAYAPAALGFYRFKIVGGALNDASTVIDQLELSYVLNI